MGIGVNDYSADNLINNIYSKYSNKSVNTNMNENEASSYLDFDSYLKLMTAQMSNQDFNDAMSDSEFIQQMASYSMMEAISQLTQQNALSYSSSLIGKAVTVNNGGYPDTGIVEAVTMTSDGCMLLVNGNQYSSDSITDVVDGEIFTKLNSLVGRTVEIKDGDDTVTGVVKGLFIKSGNGYVTLDNNQSYSFDAITSVVPIEEPEDSSEADDAAGEEGAAEVESSEASVSAANSYNNLMRMLGEEEPQTIEIDGYTFTTASADIETIAARSGLVSSGDTLDNSTSTSSDISSRIPAPSVYNQYVTTVNASNSSSSRSSSATYDKGDVSGVLTVEENDSEAQTLETYAQGATNNIPASTRKYADQYPLEAAFADYVGTHMADIRFIGNTSIMDKIDTSQVICVGESGRKYTDIGWCGIGKLGEVVTQSDGRQRVEILDSRGRKCYLHTSGKYTLRQLLDREAYPDIDVKDFTPSERAIVYFATEYTEEQKAAMKSFGEYCAWHAHYVYKEG